MPYVSEQISPRRWSVKNSETGTIHSKHTTKAKAEAQIRLLNSIHSLNGSGLIEQKYIDSLRDPSPNFPPKVPLPTIGNFDITVPPYMVLPIVKKNKKENSTQVKGYKLVKTLTKSRNISTRKGGMPSIELIPQTHETDGTVETWKTDKSLPTLNQFSKKDQAIIKKMYLNPDKTLRLKNKQRGFPEVLPKNIERHRQLGTSQLPDDFIAPPPRKRCRPKKESVAELQAQAEAQAQDMGLGDDIDFGDDGNETPTPKVEAPVKKRGRPTKYGEDDEARNKSSKEQKKLSAQLIYRNSLSQEARDKYDAKQAKKVGKGILNDIKSSFVNLNNKVVKGTKKLSNKATDLFTNVTQSDKAYPPNLTAIKNQLGNEVITSLQIGRTPVPSAISAAMNAVSLGGFNKVFKTLSFDTLFHLFLIITTDKGKFLLEKNERINVSKNIPSKDLQVKDVVIPNNLSVNELIDTTQKYMGVNFLPYDPATQNCQDFIASVLKANNIATPELLSFVKQDTSEIFKQNPNLAKISRKLTDIGAAINVVQQGGSLKIKSKHNNMDSRNMLSHNLPQAESQIRASLGIMRGGNILGDIKNAFKNIPRKAANALKIPTSVDDIKNLAAISQIPTDVGGVKRYGKTALTYTLPSLGAATLGGLAGYATGGNPYAVGAAGTLGGIVGRVGAEQANKQIGEGVGGRRRGRPRKMDGGMIVKHGGVAMPMSGKGWFDKVLDTSFTPRQAIRAAKSVPALGREAIQDIKGVGVMDGLIKIPKVRGVTEPLVNIPGISSGVVSMPMSGRGAKGSPEMREKMARLRSMKKK